MDMRRRSMIAVLAVAAALVGPVAPARAAPASPAVPKGYAWTDLVDMKVVSRAGSSDVDASAHVQTDVVVAKANRKRVLAGTVPAGGTGVAVFALHKRCIRFSSAVGMSDDSPAGGSITFSVYFGDVAELVKEPKHGRTRSISMDTTGVSRLVLRNTEPSPAGSLDDAVVAAWPGAKVLCRS